VIAGDRHDLNAGVRQSLDALPKIAVGFVKVVVLFDDIPGEQDGIDILAHRLGNGSVPGFSGRKLAARDVVQQLAGNSRRLPAEMDIPQTK
jgi:hypothetical protein